MYYIVLWFNPAIEDWDIEYWEQQMPTISNDGAIASSPTRYGEYTVIHSMSEWTVGQTITIYEGY
jgi:hypothetical protein